MPAEEVYVLRSGEDPDGGEWVSPKPVDEVVVEAVTGATDLSADDLDDLDAYVDREALAAHIGGPSADGPLTFPVEGHEVVVESDGTVGVESE